MLMVQVVVLFSEQAMELARWRVGIEETPLSRYNAIISLRSRREGRALSVCIHDLFFGKN